jgi:hypothetical protein
VQQDEIVWDPITVPSEQLVSVVTVNRDGRIDLVGAYVDACRAAGATVVTPSMRGRVGKAATALRDAGAGDDVLVAALAELARRNESPTQLASILGDVERARAGTPMGRIIPARLVVPTENPQDARIRAIREHRA